VEDPESNQVETYITLLPFQYLIVPVEFLEQMSFFEEFNDNFVVYPDEQLRLNLFEKPLSFKIFQRFTNMLFYKIAGISSQN